MTLRSIFCLSLVIALAAFLVNCDLHPGDLLPDFRTKLSMICAKERGRKYVEKQSHGGADDRGAEAVGGRA